jgi:hypothetical protein
MRPRTFYSSRERIFERVKGTLMLDTLRQRCKAFLRNKKNLQTGWLIAAAILALYIGAIREHEATEEIANSKASGLAGYSAEPLALWKQARVPSGIARMREVVADQSPADADKVQMAAFLNAAAAPGFQSQASDADRKMVRTASIDLVVQKPVEAAEKIRNLAEASGGFLVVSQISGGEDATSASLTVRVPASRYEQVRAEIRKLGLRIESERIEAQDVTRQYVDQQASLRNLRAEEVQYLAILKQAKTVKDTLDVSEKLSDVRGQIDTQQAEFEALSKQIETVAISVSLRTEAEARVFGLNWRPLYQAKLALRDGLDGLASYASTMLSAVFLLPTILLWLATIIAVCAVGWKVLRWAGRIAFGRKAAAASVPQA